MRIYNEDTDKKVNKVILYLAPDEAQELKNSLELIINNNQKHHHEHIPDREDDFKREITANIMFHWLLQIFALYERVFTLEGLYYSVYKDQLLVNAQLWHI